MDLASEEGGPGQQRWTWLLAKQNETVVVPYLEVWYYDRSVVQISQCYYYYMLPSPQFCWWLAVVLTKNNDEC